MEFCFTILQDKDDGISMKSGGFKYQNRKKLSQRELNAMHPTQRSKYLAYENPPKEATEAIASSKKRVQDKSKKHLEDSRRENEVDIEKDKHNQLIGQLKAAEARNRLRVMRLRYQANRVSLHFVWIIFMVYRFSTFLSQP
ncbi:protein LKAAEAR1-like [Lytechinus pictus]|uniref:protein LKAAEAR1-like n=1 Tax=Lytechinus pictus TaxID=7653 RepID=UPI0030B9E7A0